MHKVAPLTKIILTLVTACWALLLQSQIYLAILVICLAILFPVSKAPESSYKALASIGLFAVILGAMQYALGVSLEMSVVIGLRMIAMTGSFILLMASTRLQDITASLVRQLKVPYEYAFMFTATLRFIPDFFADIKAVQEAQACRGYGVRGNVFQKLINYLSIVQPLVLRAITKSDTMAMGLELRGFGRGIAGSYGTSIKMAGLDYLVLSGTLLASVGIVSLRLG